jgi:hypothetical protein
LRGFGLRRKLRRDADRNATGRETAERDLMPTAPKLVAGFIFGFVAWFAASLIIPHIHEVKPGTSVKWFGWICAAIGVLSGWVMSGRNAGAGLRAGLGYGLTTTALIVFWGLFIFAGNEAFERSIRKSYDGPIEAISDMIKLMIEYAQLMAKPDVLIWLVVGAVAGGIITELSARKWS